VEHIKQALAAMDPNDPEQWNRDGLPRVETVIMLSGQTVTRKEINEAWPEFTRATLMEEKTPAQPVQVPAPEPVPPPEDEQPAEQDTEVKNIGGVMVEINDPEVMALPFNHVASDLSLLERALNEFQRQYDQVSGIKKLLDSFLADIGTRSAVLSARKLKLESRDKKNPAQDIQAYIHCQQEIRNKRLRAAREFLQAGTNAQDLKAAMESRSKLDQAMSGRKPPMGAKRPHYPAMAGAH